MYIIDGYNLLYKRADMHDDKALIFAISQFCDFYTKRAIIVFDGEWDYDGEYDSNALAVYYVDDADSYIYDLIDKYPRAIVVSSDREIRKYAQSHKCKSVRSEDFDFSLPDMQYEKADSVFVSDEDVGRMLEAFKGPTS